MGLNVTQKLIKEHLIEGEMTPGKEIGLKIDQALLQDATGTLVQLELEAMNLDRAKTEVAVQYVDHNLLQTDFKNADDHVFLHSAAQSGRISTYALLCPKFVNNNPTDTNGSTSLHIAVKHSKKDKAGLVKFNMLLDEE